MSLLYIIFIFAVTGINTELQDDEDDVVSYRGYQIWRLNFQKSLVPEEVVDKINKEKNVLAKNHEYIDFLISGNDINIWKHYLRGYNITYDIKVLDVQDKIDEEKYMISPVRRKVDPRDPDIIGRLNFTSYPRLHDLEEYYARLKRQNPWAVKIITIGLTSHNTSIPCVVLSDRRPNAPAILVDGGMHGNEWTSIFTVLYFIESIAWNFTSQPEHVRSKTWFIIPILNPDGYEYSMTKDRMWKKNRRLFSGRCDGVDINRNFDISWCDFKGSIMICHNNYCGPCEFSENESLIFRDLLRYQVFTGYVTVHSYGSQVLYPFPSQEKSIHRIVAGGMARAMTSKAGVMFNPVNERNGKEYGAGSSLDWMYFVNTITHSYAIVTRGDEFFISPYDLQYAGMEVAEGLKYMAHELRT